MTHTQRNDHAERGLIEVRVSEDNAIDEKDVRNEDRKRLELRGHSIMQ